MEVIDDKIELIKLPRLDGQPLLRKFTWEDYQPFLQEDSMPLSYNSRLRNVIEKPKMRSLNFRVFLDSTVLITAAIFENGSSRLFLEVCKSAMVSILVTRLVRQEVEENIQRLPFSQGLEQYQQMIQDLETDIVPLPLPRLQAMDASDDVFGAKDAHIIAGAEAGRSTHLVTLDREHFLQDKHKRALFPIVACTPYEFMQDYLENA
jgi:predicted nucleic acid-binding protein